MKDIKKYSYVTEILVARLENDEQEAKEVKQAMNLHINELELARHGGISSLEEIYKAQIRECYDEFHSIAIEMIEIGKVLQMISKEKTILRRKSKKKVSSCGCTT